MYWTFFCCFVLFSDCNLCYFYFFLFSGSKDFNRMGRICLNAFSELVHHYCWLLLAHCWNGGLVNTLKTITQLSGVTFCVWLSKPGPQKFMLLCSWYIFWEPRPNFGLSTTLAPGGAWFWFHTLVQLQGQPHLDVAVGWGHCALLILPASTSLHPQISKWPCCPPALSHPGWLENLASGAEQP